MAHRPTNPSPYFERVDATGDIDLKFRIADHDTVTSAKVIVRSNDLSGDSFPTACVLELSDGKLTATNQTESFKSDGSASAVLTKAFLSISSVTIDGTAITSYTYNAEAHSVSFTKAPSKNAVVIVTGSISVPGDWQSEVNGGNGDYSFVNMTIPAGTLENGKDYKWQIDKLNGASVDNREFFFSTKAMPTVSIAAPTGDKITTVSASFSGNCDDDIEYYRYEVRDEDNAVIDKTENIYNANLSYVCSGLFAGDVITVYLYVKVKMRADELVASKTYEIDYALYGSQTTVEIDNDPYHNRVLVDFTGMSFIGGKTSAGNYELSDGNIHVDNGEYLLWDDKDSRPLDIPAGTGYSIKFKLDTGFYGVIAEINDAAGSFTFGYDGGFWYTVGGVKTPIDMSSWFSTASMFQPASASQSNKIFVFNTNETIDFTDRNTVIRLSDAAVKYWWYLKYYNNQISVVRGEEVNGA